MAQALIDPVLLRMVGNVTGLRVLDLGCGNGYLARKLAKQGAKVTGVDSSARLIGLARARENKDPLGITYHAADAANLELLEDESFDMTVSNMAMMNIARADVATREASRVLRPKGRLAMSLSHPLFRHRQLISMVSRESQPQNDSLPESRPVQRAT